MQDKTNRLRYFEEIFLLADTKVEMVLGILFLKFSIIDMSFGDKTLI